MNFLETIAKFGRVDRLGTLETSVDAGHSHQAVVAVSGPHVVGWTSDDDGHLHTFSMSTSVPAQTGGQIVTFPSVGERDGTLHVHRIQIPNPEFLPQASPIPGGSVAAFAPRETTRNAGHTHELFLFRNGPDRVSGWTTEDDGHIHIIDMPLALLNQFGGVLPTFQARNRSDGIEHLHFFRIGT